MRKNIIMLMWLVFILIGCQNVPEIPDNLTVKQVLKQNIEEWDISVIPRKETDNWVYDTQLEFLGDTPVNVTVIYYDKTKVTYNELKPLEPILTTGSADYKDSVYSKENSRLEFELEWEKKGIKHYGKTVFKVTPK
ncbi:hypothetical protein R4Z10_08950 [Niallia sp. XMNu-256]|uniref:hypothetical protein n=1 Tax=Niallia sp. XMNu-256 TaxID=3082444 RepID=UPI0030CC964E